MKSIKNPKKLSASEVQQVINKTLNPNLLSQTTNTYGTLQLFAKLQPLFNIDSTILFATIPVSNDDIEINVNTEIANSSKIELEEALALFLTEHISL